MVMATSAGRADAGIPSAAAEHVARRAEPCGARELYCGLWRDPARNAHFVVPAFHFAAAALRAGLAEDLPDGPEQLVRELVSWGRSSLPSPEFAGYAPSWPARVVREYAPAGLCDGAWLQGFMQTSALPSALRHNLVAQASLRLLGASGTEGAAQRYANLLRSLGIVPEAITRWEFSESQPCADISYEHALLGLSLGLFPCAFGAETLGFNLWMATLGPVPLLERLSAPLREQGAWLQYLQAREHEPLASAARDAVAQALRLSWTDDAARKIAAGFAAAHHSYLRWERAMWSGNVPFTPADSVLEMVRRKARFAAEHHGAVRVRGRNVQELLEAGEGGHQLLVDVLASSHWIRPGDPEGSRLLSHSLSIGGPMFDAFTASEKTDLSAWVLALGKTDRADAKPRTRVELAGHYTAPHDPIELEALAAREGSEIGCHTLRWHAESDAEPVALPRARRVSEQLVRQLAHVLETDPRLEPCAPPLYGDHAVRSLAAPAASALTAPEDTSAGARAAGAAATEDAFWLAGFADVRRMEYGEYVHLARSYFALQRSAREPTPIPEPLALFARVAGRTTHAFVPELLGLHLGFLSQHREHEPWREWAVLAVHAFMKRTQESTRAGAVSAWQRLWRLWRCHALLRYGTAEQRQILTRQFRSALEGT